MWAFTNSFPDSCGLDQLSPIKFSSAYILTNSLQFCQPGIILQYNSSSIAQTWLEAIFHCKKLLKLLQTALYVTSIFHLKYGWGPSLICYSSFKFFKILVMFISFIFIFWQINLVELRDEGWKIWLHRCSLLASDPSREVPWETSNGCVAWTLVIVPFLTSWRKVQLDGCCVQQVALFLHA